MALDILLRTKISHSTKNVKASASFGNVIRTELLSKLCT